MQPRYLEGPIRDLALSFHKMAFVSGPRQCGKTTLGRRLLADRGEGRYYNWDETSFRRTWTKSPNALVPGAAQSRRTPLLLFDKVHKAKNWKRTLKGIYDSTTPACDILVTGSARLNGYKKGGDSLMGRYLNFRLHPFSVGELSNPGAQTEPDEARTRMFEAGPSTANSSPLPDLWTFGGFPEPYLRQSHDFLNIWRQSRTEKIVREDLRDLSRLPELSQVEMLVSLLPERAGGTLSVQSLREDLEVGHQTVGRWLTYLKELYYHFELRPFSQSVPRSLKRESKLYLWDWSELDDVGARFENLVASHLLKACHFWTDTGKGQFEIFYLRNKDRKEVDFLITRKRKPWLTVEAKTSDSSLDTTFLAFSKHLGLAHHIQIVSRERVWSRQEIGGVNALVASASDVLVHLP